MPASRDGSWKRQNWDVYWPTSGLRYGSDCRQCGRLLTSWNKHFCRICRANFTTALEEGTPLPGRATETMRL